MVHNFFHTQLFFTRVLVTQISWSIAPFFTRKLEHLDALNPARLVPLVFRTPSAPGSDAPEAPCVTDRVGQQIMNTKCRGRSPTNGIASQIGCDSLYSADLQTGSDL